LHGLSQPALSIIAKRVATAIARKARQFIKMPEGIDEQQVVVGDFHHKLNFPQVIGAIDGTHIRIKKINGDSGQYYVNRKGYYSLNIQVS
jgi:nuclease HARBI1